MSSLGKLKKVDLREGWKHEAYNFTQWLAEEENLRLLGDEIGLDITLLQTEAQVGSFCADILAEEENTGRKIIIENQLESTNHSHLGQIITYASGYDARVIVWVVKDVREEHRQAVDWLNEHTHEDIQFFLVKIELWQIADSPLAPKFEIASKPNDWTKSVRSSVEVGELTETKAKQLQFWSEFKEFTKKHNAKFRHQKSYPQHWTDISIGSSDAYISLTLNTRESLLGASVYIPNNKALYAHLAAHKEQIENELGEKPEWMELPTKKASRIRILAPGDFYDETKWNEHFTWFMREVENFFRVFPKYLKNASRQSTVNHSI